MSAHFLAVETGGTKVVARLAGSDLDTTGRWPTTTPDQAVADVLDFVRNSLTGGQAVTALGMAAFGPIILDGVDAGKLLATPKPHWSGANVARALAEALDCPFRVETDVNAAALAEHALRPGANGLAYLTVGTGIGGGLSWRGETLHGALHPEIGHLTLLRAVGDDAPSACPFHPSCAEGLVAGPALQARLGGHELAVRPEIMSLAAGYIAQLIASVVLAWSPETVVLGGGVGTAPGMLDAVREALPRALGGYGVGEAALRGDFVVAPQLYDAGLEGAMLLARRLAG